VLQPTPLNKNLVSRFEIQKIGGEKIMYEFDLEESLDTWCLGSARSLLTVNSCIEFHLDLQADKSPIVVKGPFFPRVVNPRYRIRGTNV
jgi:hypothetical protein